MRIAPALSSSPPDLIRGSTVPQGETWHRETIGCAYSGTRYSSATPRNSSSSAARSAPTSRFPPAPWPCSRASPALGLVPEAPPHGRTERARGRATAPTTSTSCARPTPTGRRCREPDRRWSPTSTPPRRCWRRAAGPDVVDRAARAGSPPTPRARSAPARGRPRSPPPPARWPRRTRPPRAAARMRWYARRVTTPIRRGPAGTATSTTPRWPPSACARAARPASPCSTSTATTATARRACSGSAATCCSSPSTATRTATTRGMSAAPTSAAPAPARAIT